MRRCVVHGQIKKERKIQKKLGSSGAGPGCDNHTSWIVGDDRKIAFENL